ncbi:Geranylgeranyl pyrophosphate synthase [Halotydeus destructor]|nr:Geranylgeranyl pyrophosphate synthase [Halotydeus destructor]
MDYQTESRKAVLQPFEYIRSLPAKNFRSKFFNVMNNWVQVPIEVLEMVTEAIDSVHNASLLMDDIQDNSQLRRGHKCGHLVFGIPITINTACFVYFDTLSKLITKSPPHLRADISAIYVDHLLMAHQGQGMDLFWRDNFKCPTEDDYVQMVKQKTGVLLSMGVELMKVYSGCQLDLAPLALLIGCYFQIRDDYANLMLDEYAAKKSFCEDLTEGKFSFLIVHSVNSKPEDGRLIDILKQRTTDEQVKKEAVNIIKSTDSFNYALNKLESVSAEIKETINQLGGNDQLVTLLESLYLN